MNSSKIKKVIITVFLICVAVFSNTNKVFAASITWNQIVTEFKKNSSIINASVVSNENSMNITGNGADYSKYSIKFKYENDLISLIPRNKADFSEAELSSYIFTDMLIVAQLMETIMTLYDVDEDTIEEDKMQEYGINMNTTDFEYTDDNGRISGDYIETFSIDLNAFEAKVANQKEITTTSNKTTTKIINTTTKISNTNVSNTGSNNNVSSNVQTGTAAIIFAWITGIIAVAASILYFSQVKKNEV